MWLVRIELVEEDPTGEERCVSTHASRMPTERAAWRFYGWMHHRFQNYGLIRKLDEQEKLRLFGMLRGPKSAQHLD